LLAPCSQSFPALTFSLMYCSCALCLAFTLHLAMLLVSRVVVEHSCCVSCCFEIHHLLCAPTTPTLPGAGLLYALLCRWQRIIGGLFENFKQHVVLHPTLLFSHGRFIEDSSQLPKVPLGSSSGTQGWRHYSDLLIIVDIAGQISHNNYIPPESPAPSLAGASSVVLHMSESLFLI
jgi:hypothetical protein